MLEIRPEPPRQPDVIALLEASDAFSEALYPPESNHLLDVASLEKPTIRFLVARRAGIAIACGAIVLAPDGTAELKRMFVAETARGTGCAQALMAALEQAAHAEGVTALRLETGIHSHAALRLYERHGYARRGPFAEYRDDPLSVFMEKPLAPPRKDQA
jgi:putative acetyltransferase